MQEERMYVPLTFEYLLSFLFGKRTYHGFVAEHKISNWKKHMLKVTNGIRKAIIVNLDNCDEFHRKELLGLCERAEKEIKKAKRKDEVNSILIEFLIKMVFELMGLPENWHRKVVNRLEDWRLNKYRKLVYTQTAQQKANLMLYLARRYKTRYKGRLPEETDLCKMLRHEFKGDSRKFVEWFRNKCKNIYLDIF